MKRIVFCLSAAMICTMLWVSSASAVIINDSTGTSHRFDGPWTVGNLFEVGGSDIVINALGVQDSSLTGPATDGFVAGSVNVGLWNAGGTSLLASATVASADTLIGTYRYAAFDLGGTVTLTAGTSYLIGAAVGDGIEYFEDGATFTGSGVTLTASRHVAGGTLAAPGNDSGAVGRWAPANATLIPEPSSVLLLSCCAIGFAWRRRRKSR